jgi:hypothetical protein
MARVHLMAALAASALACADNEAARSSGDRSDQTPDEAKEQTSGGATAGEDGGGRPQSRSDAESTTRAPTPDGEPGGSSGEACGVVRSEVQRLPVHLAFAFDVSGSMGKGDKPWHDKQLKWDPVVSAVRSFFEAPASSGLTASLTFFPADGGEDARCSLESYVEPTVPMTPLPSPAFGAAISAVEPTDEDDWRGGTPTAWVMRGSQQFIADYQQDHLGKYAIVLVTDGYPQDCDEEDDRIEAVVDEAKRALGNGIATYVIGVRNPNISGAPDIVSDLDKVAFAGGTDKTYFIDTGEPSATAKSLQTAIDTIRESTISCSLRIPEPSDGRPFDKSKVSVQYASGSTDSTLAYDQTCMASGAWRYDDPAAPTQIQLCEQTCDDVEADPQAKLEVTFECNPVIVF